MDWSHPGLCRVATFFSGLGWIYLELRGLKLQARGAIVFISHRASYVPRAPSYPFIHSFFGLTFKVLCGIFDLYVVNLRAIYRYWLHCIIIPLWEFRLYLRRGSWIWSDFLHYSSNLPFPSHQQRQEQHLFWILGAAIFRFDIVGAVQPDHIGQADPPTDATPWPRHGRCLGDRLPRRAAAAV